MISLALTFFLVAILPGEWGFGAALFGAIAVVGSIAHGMENGLREVDGTVIPSMTKKQNAIVSRLRLPATTVPILAASVRRDEAASWLKFWRTVGEAPQVVWIMAKWAMITAAIAVIGLVIAGIAFEEAGGSAERLKAYGTLAVGIALILLVMARRLINAMAVFPWLVRGNPLVFGGEGLLDNSLVSIRCVPIPPEASLVIPWTVDMSTGSGLRHSRVYSDSVFIEQLLKRIAAMLRNYDRQPSASNRAGPVVAPLVPLVQGAPAVSSPSSVQTPPSRSGPCPCGSGKRYKHCHGTLA